MGMKTIVGKLSIYHRPASHEELERKEIKHKSCVYFFLMTNVNWNITILNFLQFYWNRHFVQLFGNGIDIFYARDNHMCASISIDYVPPSNLGCITYADMELPPHYPD